MNNDEAKFILSAYRPSGRDASDVRFTEALNQAKQDPALSEWLAQSQALDAVVMKKLSGIIPPAGLREQILAGGKVSQKAPVRRRNLGAWLALAASFLVVFVVSEVWLGQKVQAAQHDYAEFAVNDMHNGGHHPPTGEGMEEMLVKLASSDLHFMSDLGLSFEELKAGGCRTVKCGEREAIELCFNRDGTWYHLYVMPHQKSRGPMLAKSKSYFLAMSNSAAAVWTDGDFEYALVSPKGMSDLKQLAG